MEPKAETLARVDGELAAYADPVEVTPFAQHDGSLGVELLQCSADEPGRRDNVLLSASQARRLRVLLNQWFPDKAIYGNE